MSIIAPTSLSTAVADAWYHVVATLVVAEHSEQALPPFCPILPVAELLVAATAAFENLPR
jgi:hypothetical protein